MTIGDTDYPDPDVVKTVVESVKFASYQNDAEIFIGIVGPVGLDMQLVVSSLEYELAKFDYESVPIRISELANGLRLGVKVASSPLDANIESKMMVGNKLRAQSGENAAFAFLSCIAVRQHRKDRTGNPNVPDRRTAYILHQFKRPEEIEALRRIYGHNFLQISVHSDETRRLHTLADKISHSSRGAESSRQAQKRALSLMIRDEEEHDDAHGQRLRDTFHLADVIVDSSSKPKLEKGLSRAMDGFFGNPFISPTVDEYFMSISKSVARRSADLSRQVGAAIMRVTGEVASLGCNEVPKAGGGTYWEGDEDDSRDFVLGFDPNIHEKSRILKDIIRRVTDVIVKNSDQLNMKIKESETDDQSLVLNELLEKNSKEFKDALLMDLLGFGRVVHAEMNAITDAARLGIPLQSGTLYSTTFPCHMCARHIIAAGITRVVYLEPYVKSLTSQLYSDSVELEALSGQCTKKVRFEPFVGIAPPLYDRLFGRGGKRKDAEGNAVKWHRKDAQPVVNQIIPSYLFAELRITDNFASLLRNKDLL